MSVLGRLSRTTYRAHRYERAVKNPARYVRNRAVAKGLGLLGFWSLMRRVWR